MRKVKDIFKKICVTCTRWFKRCRSVPLYPKIKHSDSLFQVTWLPILNQSDCIISALHNYAKICLWHRLLVMISKQLLSLLWSTSTFHPGFEFQLRIKIFLSKYDGWNRVKYKSSDIDLQFCAVCLSRPRSICQDSKFEANYIRYLATCT